MGYAERKNLNSKWNKSRATNPDLPSSTQTTQKSSFVNKVSIPTKDEPMVIEINPKGIFTLFKEFLCRMLKVRPAQGQSHALTS